MLKFITWVFVPSSIVLLFNIFWKEKIQGSNPFIMPGSFNWRTLIRVAYISASSVVSEVGIAWSDRTEHALCRCKTQQDMPGSVFVRLQI